MQYGNNTYPYNTLCNCRFSPKFRIREKQFDRKKPHKVNYVIFFFMTQNIEGVRFHGVFVVLSLGYSCAARACD